MLNLCFPLHSEENRQSFLGTLELKMLCLSSSIDPVAGNAIELRVVKRWHKLQLFTMLVTLLLILSLPTGQSSS